MEGKFSLVITGDSIINRRLSVHDEERFLSLIKIIRNADVAYTHFEMLIHEYDGPEVYPAAEAGWTWMRAPRFVADELKWAGFNIVSHASNHCLDYSYGGLLNTLKVFDEACIPHAGTGRNLGEAREPAYLETEKGRVALVSMCSSFTRWSRAGETRRDMKGRPGLNPLRYYHIVDSETIKELKRIGSKLGWWITQDDRALLLNPAGLHNTIYRFVLGNSQGVCTMAEESDVEANLRSIKDASRQADYVLVHLHSHEYDPSGGLTSPAKFVAPFAKLCIDAGADVFVEEGSHVLRGIEIYKNKPILYDPGDLMKMSNTTTRLPSDFYWRHGYGSDARSWDATPADGFDARITASPPLNPRGGYESGGTSGCVVAVCTFGENKELKRLKLYPCTHIHEPRSQRGRPILADENMSRIIIEHLRELSSTYGTTVEFRENVGFVKLCRR